MKRNRRQVKRDIKKVRQDKSAMVKEQKYDQAANLRAREQILLQELEALTSSEYAHKWFLKQDRYKIWRERWQHMLRWIFRTK